MSSIGRAHIGRRKNQHKRRDTNISKQHCLMSFFHYSIWYGVFGILNTKKDTNINKQDRGSHSDVAPLYIQFFHFSMRLFLVGIDLT